MTVTIREATAADSPALADIVIDSMEAAFRGRVPDACLAWLTREESAANWRRFLDPGGRADGRFLYVAEADGRVVGCALAGPQPAEPGESGELYLLGVLPAQQRRGIGRRLVAVVADRLARAGMRALVVRVLTANPNRAFYERLGARYEREEPYDWNGVTLAMAVYRWPDAAGLMSQLAERRARSLTARHWRAGTDR